MIVSLECAYVWSCPACQVRQYVDPVPVELNAAEAEEAARETKIPVALIHHCLHGEPEEVECVSCGCVYPTREAE